MNTNKNQNKHIPVLLKEVIAYLQPKAGESYLDLTAGYGGHAKAIIQLTKDVSKATLVDRDKEAISYLSTQEELNKAELIKSDFQEATKQLEEKGRTYDLILADLGLSSPHLNEASRGFSIKNLGPLDMRMDQSQALRAEAIINSYSESDLAKIIREYGEEPKANKIAGLIAGNRPIYDTQTLAKVIQQAWPRHSKIHPATKTFQAIRIVVNDEINQLKNALPLWIKLLKPGGRIVVISFHSLEDRIVKQFFKESSGKRFDAELQILTKHPVRATINETVSNPRARSAKLRAAAKIKTRKGAD